MNQEQTNITTGKQIRHLRTQLGMTQEELAGELNVTRQALSNWERDVNEPDLNMLKKICFLFGVNMDDFAKEVITKMETYEKKEKRQFNKYDIPSAIYCDALIHCQLVNFEEMTREEKLDFLLAAAYEIMGVEDIEEYPDEHEEDADLYNAATERLNTGKHRRFPVRQAFYEAMDEAFDPSKPMYRNEFDQFLNDRYGVDPNPFETGDFEW